MFQFGSLTTNEKTPKILCLFRSITSLDISGPHQRCKYMKMEHSIPKPIEGSCVASSLLRVSSVEPLLWLIDNANLTGKAGHVIQKSKLMPEAQTR
jgi:hypothetical protein